VSRSRAERLRRRCADEAGFGLVEIMIAMTIFAIVSLSTAPMLIGGLQAGRAAQLNLQGKALAQERVELMRNLPFHVARQNGQYLDVLDIYFRDLQPTGALAPNDTCNGGRSYDGSTWTYSCAINNLGPDYPGFRQVVRATFLDFQRNTVRPPTSPAYNSQVAGVDAPVSTLLGIAVTTTWSQGAKQSSYTLRSQIANAQPAESALRASLSTKALSITSSLSNGDVLQLEGGLLDNEGSLTTGSSASLSVVAARAGLSSGLAKTGALLSLTAPPLAQGNSPTGTGQMLDGTCALACFSQTSVTGNQDVTVSLGQPQVSTAADPVLGSLRRTGSDTYRGFSYNNASSAELDPQLRLTGTTVSAGTGSTTEVLSGTGYLDATGTGANAVRSAGTVRLPVFQLFPTDFAPQGVVQVTLDHGSLSCASGGGAGAVVADWAGEVRYWQQTGVDPAGAPTGSYVSHALAPGANALPLPEQTAVLKADPAVSGLAPGDIPLSRWVQSWSALTDPASAVESSGQRSTGKVNGIVSLLSAPTRAAGGVVDETSAVNVSVGALSCHAEDNR
jgi:prepilin-type N-terminal cleavage/methylation domain-containing protein